MTMFVLVVILPIVLGLMLKEMGSNSVAHNVARVFAFKYKVCFARSVLQTNLGVYTHGCFINKLILPAGPQQKKKEGIYT